MTRLGEARVRCSPWLLAALVTGCQTPLHIRPPTLPDARVSEPYRTAIIVERAETPIASIGVIEGGLPPGLVIVFERHQETPPTIEGIPSQAGTYRFRVNVSCFGTNFAGQHGEQDMTLVVRDLER